MKLLSAALLGSFVACVAAPAVAGDLTIAVDGIRSNSGHILVAIDKNASGFNNLDKRKSFATFTIPARQQGSAFTLHNVPAGSYAVSLFHDANDNQNIDLTSKGYPSEGFGYSNNVGAKKAKVSFSEASFTVSKKPVTKSIRLVHIK